LLFDIGYLLVALVFVAVGLCLLLAPGTYFALLDRMARVDLWAKPSPSWDPKARRWRAVGLGVVLFGLFLIVGPVVSAYLQSPEEFNQRLHSPHHGASWGAVILWLFFFVLGLAFLGKPLAVLDRVSPRKLSTEPYAQRHTYMLRILGGLFLVISLFGICIQLIRYFRH